MTSLLPKVVRRLKRDVQLGFQAFLNLILLPVARAWPRSDDRWLFGHQGETFAGNSKYLFLWLSANRRDIKVAWISGDERTRRMIVDSGLVAHRRWSPAGILAALRSKVFIYCHGVTDLNLPLSGGAVLFNLWHGVGLKPIMFGDGTGVVSRSMATRSHPIRKYFLLHVTTLPDYVVTTSDFMQMHFASQFQFPAERCPQLGYSRLDCGRDPALKAMAARMDDRENFALNPGGFSEIYIYMPTFRDTARPFLEEALPDLAQLSEALAARNAFLYLKMHRRTADRIGADFRNIGYWPEAIDFYTYIDAFDGLITDYSSVLYDYLQVHDRGAILYTFDYDSYLSKDRPLLYPFEDNVAGVRASSFAELCDVLRSGAALEPLADAARIRKKFWGTHAGPASPRIVSYIERTVLPAAGSK